MIVDTMKKCTLKKINEQVIASECKIIDYQGYIVDNQRNEDRHICRSLIGVLRVSFLLTSFSIGEKKQRVGSFFYQW